MTRMTGRDEDAVGRELRVSSFENVAPFESEYDVGGEGDLVGRLRSVQSSRLEAVQPQVMPHRNSPMDASVEPDTQRVSRLQPSELVGLLWSDMGLAECLMTLDAKGLAGIALLGVPITYCAITGAALLKHFATWVVSALPQILSIGAIGLSLAAGGYVSYGMFEERAPGNVIARALALCVGAVLVVYAFEEAPTSSMQ